MTAFVVSTKPKGDTIFVDSAAQQKEVVDKVERILLGGQIQIYWFNSSVDEFKK